MIGSRDQIIVAIIIDIHGYHVLTIADRCADAFAKAPRVVLLCGEPPYDALAMAECEVEVAIPIEVASCVLGALQGIGAEAFHHRVRPSATIVLGDDHIAARSGLHRVVDVTIPIEIGHHLRDRRIRGYSVIQGENARSIILEPTHSWSGCQRHQIGIPIAIDIPADRHGW